MQKINNEKGITLIILVVTIIVLALISVPTILKVEDIIKINKLTKYKDDFTIITESVSQVYSLDDSLATIGPRYPTADLNHITDKNVNDNNDYYVIDMDKLNNDLHNKLRVNSNIETLNYGKSNYNILHGDSITTDVYVINSRSRTVYYVAGFLDANGNTIYRYPGSYSNIQIENY